MNQPNPVLARWAFASRSALLQVSAWLLVGSAFAADEAREPASTPSDESVYRTVIAPIFLSHCVDCHGADKSKGDLRLHTPADICEGGDLGAVIVEGKPSESPLYQRIILPERDPDGEAMPPEGKPRLADWQKNIISAWIQDGADFRMKLRDLEIPENLRSMVQSQVAAVAIKSVTDPVITASPGSHDPGGPLARSWEFANKYCFDCHGEIEDGVKAELSIAEILRKGYLTQDDGIWNSIIEAVEVGYMPPKAPIPSGDRDSMVRALEQTILTQPARSVERPPGIVRRLTRLELNNALRDLLKFNRDVIVMAERFRMKRDYFQPRKENLGTRLPIDTVLSESTGQAVFQRIGLPQDKRSETGFNNDVEVLNITSDHFRSNVELADALVSESEAVARSRVMRGLLSDPPQLRLGQVFLLLILAGAWLRLKRAGVGSRLLGFWTIVLAFGILLQLTRLGFNAEYELACVGCLAFFLPFRTRHDDPSGGKSGGRVLETLVVGAIQAAVLLLLSLSRGVDLALGVWLVGVVGMFKLAGNQSFRCRMVLSLKCLLVLVPGLIWNAMAKLSGKGVLVLLLELRLARYHDPSGMVAEWLPPAVLFGMAASVLFVTVIIARFFPRGVSLAWSSFVCLIIIAFLLLPRTKRPILGLLDGGYPTPSVVDAVAHERMDRFIERAFRSPVEADTRQRFIGVVKSAIAEGSSFREGMSRAITAVLLSPRVLFRFGLVEPGSVPDQYDWNLANQLSFFLWKTAPDAVLLEAAANGDLRDEDLLRAQVQRMLKDVRIKEFTEDFGTQWMHLAGIETARPDKKIYPEFYGEDEEGTMALSMKIEPILLFESILVEDRSISDFLNSDSTYINANLAAIYGLEDRVPEQLRREKSWKEDMLWYRIDTRETVRGGLATMAGPLTVTSLTARTSAVKRGIWMLDVLQNRPPREPNVAANFQREEAVPGETFRQKLNRHRQDPACASCHNVIDPIGFALEGFDPIGRSRTDDNEQAIDASGKMLTGEEFDGSDALKDVMMAKRKIYVRGFVEKLAMYAIGRKLRAADRPEITAITDGLEARDYRLSAAIEAIVLSPLFRSY